MKCLVPCQSAHLFVRGTTSVDSNAGEEAEGKNYDPNGLRKLRKCFKQFVGACKIALQQHLEMLAGDQPEYHENLQLGFDEFRKVVEPLLQRNAQRERSGNNPSSRGSMRSLASQVSSALPNGAPDDFSEV